MKSSIKSKIDKISSTAADLLLEEQLRRTMFRRILSDKSIVEHAIGQYKRAENGDKIRITYQIEMSKEFIDDLVMKIEDRLYANS